MSNPRIDTSPTVTTWSAPRLVITSLWRAMVPVVKAIATYPSRPVATVISATTREPLRRRARCSSAIAEPTRPRRTACASWAGRPDTGTAVLRYTLASECPKTC